MRVAGYARVSTDLQRDNQTIKTQVELIEKFCSDRGFTLIETYSDDGVTGTLHLHERPAGRRLIADARADRFDGLVVYKGDRIGRDTLINETVVAELYDRLGIDFFGIAEQIDLASSMGRMMFTMHSAISRMERENTLRRSRDATERYAREGAWLGGIVPFGYRVQGVDKDSRLVISEELIPDVGLSEAEAVRLMYRLAGDEGLSCMMIADRFNALGIPTSYTRDGRELLRNKRRQRTSDLWRCARIRNMLIETTYKGLHRWGKRGSKRRPKDIKPAIIERAVPALVDEDLWERAQETLRRNRAARPDVPRRLYLLRGLMKCKLCGLTYSGTVHKGQKAERHTPEELAHIEVRDGITLRRYYICNGKNASHQIYGRLATRCPASSIQADALEAAIWRDIESYLDDPGAVLERLSEQMRERHTDADATARTLIALQTQLGAKEDERNHLFRLARQSLLSDAELKRQLAEVGDESEGLRSEVQRLGSEIDRAREESEALISVESLLQRLNTIREGELTWDTKRRIVEALVAAVEIESVALDPTNPRSRRVPTVHVSYAFDAPRAVIDAPQLPSSCGAEREQLDSPRGRNGSTVPSLSPAENGVGAPAATSATPNAPASARPSKFDAT